MRRIDTIILASNFTTNKLHGHNLPTCFFFRKFTQVLPQRRNECVFMDPDDESACTYLRHVCGTALHLQFIEAARTRRAAQNTKRAVLRDQREPYPQGQVNRISFHSQPASLT